MITVPEPVGFNSRSFELAVRRCDIRTHRAGTFIAKKLSWRPSLQSQCSTGVLLARVLLLFATVTRTKFEKYHIIILRTVARKRLLSYCVANTVPLTLCTPRRS